MERQTRRVAPLQILCIDDDQNDKMLLDLACSMGRVNARMHFVCDGQEAISYLEGKRPYNNRLMFPLPGLILLDLKMPKVSGFHVLEWLRENRKTRRTPVAVLTGAEAPGQMALSYALGADAFLIKPCHFSRLTSMLQSLCDYCLRHRHVHRRGARDGNPSTLFSFAAEHDRDLRSTLHALGSTEPAATGAAGMSGQL